ncbi:response regulator [Chungangia koreensis]|uniref:Heme response regulator HssR n=1 Tax=Chungangia koreensis TaxID=752657 RepID=A0ABV8X0F8_9LACT
MFMILVVDDDPHILKLVGIHLQKEGYQTIKASSADEALAILEQTKPDMAILDVMMPGMNGYDLTSKIREQSDLPVLLLTAKGTLDDKEKGFLAGSDDYVVKPFEPKELLFRVAAILRRVEKPNQAIIEAGPLTINRNSYEIVVDSRILLLPLKEFELLSLLAAKPGQVFTRQFLLENVWGYDYEGDEQTLNVHIKRIREKLSSIANQVVITTVRGIGYKLELITL